MEFRLTLMTLKDIDMHKSGLALFSLSLYLVCGCSEKTGITAPEDRSQVFTIAVESVGELFSASDTETRSPITSVKPTQTFDMLSFIIIRNESPARVVYKQTIHNWSSPDNLSSIPWNNEKSQGRYTRIRLDGDRCLEEGVEYMIYAIGYQSGSFGGYVPFRDIKEGDTYRQTEVADIPSGWNADEIFAGADIFYVKDRHIVSGTSIEEGLEDGIVILRRQVAGTFGFFTDIPAEADGKPVYSLRLVATKENSSIIFGGFRSIEDGQSFNKENVVNGMNPRTDFDARLSGSESNDAFTVYEIELAKWFPGNTENPELPLDMNGDGILGNGDKNWRTDSQTYPDGTIYLPEGSIFGDSYLVAFEMTAEDTEKGMPTFQLQLTGTDGTILRYWDVHLRDTEDTGDSRSVVTLPDGESGRTSVHLSENKDTENCFSVVRNRLYTIGEKTYGQEYGESYPVALDPAGSIVLDARHEWKIANTVIFR